ELLGKRAHDLLHYAMGDGSTVDEADSPLGRAYAEGDPLRGHEAVFWNQAGEAMPVECSVVPLNIGGKRDGTVVVFRNISDRKSADQMRWEMMHDGLTGAANKRHFNQALAQELGKRAENGGYSALLLIDLDRFSLIETQAGRALTDRLLADVVARLKERLRQDDVLARLEEDHFGLILSGVQLDNLASLADAAREQIGRISFPMYGKTQQLSATVGVAVLSSDTPSAEYALEQSRIACQTAKRRGGNQTQIQVSDADQRIARELDAGWITKLKEALHEDRFLLQTQPIVRAKENGNGELLFELLIRMLNRDGEQIAPSVFVPLAERVGMMDKIDLWVLGQALKHLKALKKSPEVCFTVNLSNVTVQDASSLRLIEEQIRASGVDPARIIFEVTETAEIASLHSARRFILTLKELGCRFALDDFGTGFSSISHLKHLPVDFVKLEGSLICDLQESDRDRTMVSAITSLAHSLGLQVIAEHVDSQGSLEWLKGCGVDYVQGHFLGEPQAMSETDFARSRAA
ncbi:MAG: EAL domain-containing protein, partial [Xanthomonadales bacterium]|nr:EAL domain-containing protein [Xanthomonadales bacterium]